MHPDLGQYQLGNAMCSAGAVDYEAAGHNEWVIRRNMGLSS